MTIEYTLDLDYETWLPVPLEFPWNGYDTAMSWAHDLTADLLAGRGAPDEVHRALEATALERAVMPPPLEAAIERFWRRPDTGAPDRVVHLYAIDDGAVDADELAELARIGIGGYVQSTTLLEGTAFELAARVILLLQLGQGTVSVARLIGVHGGSALMLELIDDNVASFAYLEPDLERLFRSFRVRTA